MTLSSKKYLTAAVVIIVYIEEVSALIATFCKFAWWNCTKKKACMNCFHKELHVTTIATATIIVSYANAVTLNVTLSKNFEVEFPVHAKGIR